VTLFMVFDVESIGLHGEGFAVGWAVVDTTGLKHDLDEGILSSDPRFARGAHYPEFGPDRDDFDWVDAHVPRAVRELKNCVTAREVRDEFWKAYQRWKAQGAVLAADVPWPVEARFLTDCVRDQLGIRAWNGPYPLIDIASVRFAAGLDPIGTEERLPREEPAHDPLADARQSARLLVEALHTLSVKVGRA
jgi:hypothetical protein